MVISRIVKLDNLFYSVNEQGKFLPEIRDYTMKKFMGLTILRYQKWLVFEGEFPGKDLSITKRTLFTTEPHTVTKAISGVSLQNIICSFVSHAFIINTGCLEIAGIHSGQDKR